MESGSIQSAGGRAEGSGGRAEYRYLPYQPTNHGTYVNTLPWTVAAVGRARAHGRILGINVHPQGGADG